MHFKYTIVWLIIFVIIFDCDILFISHNLIGNRIAHLKSFKKKKKKKNEKEKEKDNQYIYLQK